MSKRSDQTEAKYAAGTRFGRLVVLSTLRGFKHYRIKVRALCDCGVKKTFWGTNLSRGYTRSCGCLNKEVASARALTHGETHNELYGTWANMLTRCYNASVPGYRDYGGRGISVCEEWRHDFAQFLKDMGPCPAQHSLDRIDNDGNYCPENCRWATYTQQGRNKRSNRWLTYGGETRCLSEWADRFSVGRATLRFRIDRKGWSVEKALGTPVRKQNLTPKTKSVRETKSSQKRKKETEI